ncbi:MAG: hypothetical protein AB7S71_01420 [Dongiaceae bacterium]
MRDSDRMIVAEAVQRADPWAYVQLRVCALVLELTIDNEGQAAIDHRVDAILALARVKIDGRKRQ